VDRDAALAWAATEVAVRGEVLEALRAGRTTLADVLVRAAHVEHIGRIRVLKAVEAVPGMGKVVCRRLLVALGIDETTPLAAVDATALVPAVEQACR
jgi:hypothetical protein